MFRLTLPDTQEEILVEKEGDRLKIDGSETHAELQKINQNTYLAYCGPHVHELIVLKKNATERKYTILLNGRKLEVQYESKLDLLLKSMGFEQGGKNKAKNLTAPMPGLILDVKVSVGQAVAAGDPILVLEAMKMENVLKSPGTATIKEIKVNQGQKVDKNQILVVFE